MRAPCTNYTVSFTRSNAFYLSHISLSLRKPDPRLSVRLKALRSVLRIARKCFWSFLKIKRSDQASIRYLWFVSRFLCGSIVSYLVRSFHHTRLKTMSNSGKVSSPMSIHPAFTPHPIRNRLADQSRKPAIQYLAQCLWNVLINMIIQVYLSFELLHENPSFGLAVLPPLSLRPYKCVCVFTDYTCYFFSVNHFRETLSVFSQSLQTL